MYGRDRLYGRLALIRLHALNHNGNALAATDAGRADCVLLIGPLERVRKVAHDAAAGGKAQWVT
jgi:hypothetical protein